MRLNKIFKKCGLWEVRHVEEQKNDQSDTNKNTAPKSRTATVREFSI